MILSLQIHGQIVMENSKDLIASSIMAGMINRKTGNHLGIWITVITAIPIVILWKVCYFCNRHISLGNRTGGSLASCISLSSHSTSGWTSLLYCYAIQESQAF